ncbi:hypothetical protein [Luteimonas saliphila]|uniref:hypothetical protein n=1 Tax=Luteimonas saliphila TaxID=2804919 RepID=UPI00192D9527|nr:hypothetical protein [Luteimonas saliphila]
MRLTALRMLAGVAVLLGAAAVLLPRLVPGMPRDFAIVLFVGALMLAAMAMAHRGSPDDCDTAPPGLTRRYLRELMASMAAYVLVLSASIWLLRRVEPQALRLVIAIAPLLPIGFAVRAIVRYMRGLDEMQQRIELESVGVATVCVSMLYMTGGLLQSARLMHVPGDVAMIWVFPLVCAVYGVAKAFVARRYR